MKRRRIGSLVALIVLLAITNLVTVVYYSDRASTKNEQLVVAYNVIIEKNSRIEELTFLQEENEQLKASNAYLSEAKEKLKNQAIELIQDNNTLTISMDELNRKTEELGIQNEEMEQTLSEYEYVLYYDPVELEESHTYIAELEKRLEESGGFDKFELPKRAVKYEEFTIYLEDGANQKWADQAITYIRMLPNKVLITLKEAGWIFIITPRSLEKTYESGVMNTVGLAVYLEKRIYVLNDSFSINFCSLHEIGHALDYENDYLSFENKWTTIYEEEASTSGLSFYFRSSASEYFAEVFQEYFVNPEALRENASKSFRYMEEFVNRYR